MDATPTEDKSKTMPKMFIVSIDATYRSLNGRIIVPMPSPESSSIFLLHCSMYDIP